MERKVRVRFAPSPNGPGVSILQDSYGGLRDAFGIRNPKDYWFASNYALKNL